MLRDCDPWILVHPNGIPELINVRSDQHQIMACRSNQTSCHIRDLKFQSVYNEILSTLENILSSFKSLSQNSFQLINNNWEASPSLLPFHRVGTQVRQVWRRNQQSRRDAFKTTKPAGQFFFLGIPIVRLKSSHLTKNIWVQNMTVGFGWSKKKISKKSEAEENFSFWSCTRLI